MISLRLSFTFLCFLIASSAPCAPLFEVIPPEKAPFNYPDPPREGAPDYFHIAQDGHPRCVIVRSAGARGAAELLKAYLDLTTGASFEIVDANKKIKPGFGAIHVGDTPVAQRIELSMPDVRYGDDVVANINGFLIETPDPQTLLIRGATERATVCGVVGFLKRYVGVRHYWAGNPGDIGDVVPSHPTLAVPQVTWRDWPYFLSRSLSGLSMAGPPKSEPYLKVATDDFFRINYTIPSNESYYKWLPAEPYGKTHPEYFPLFQGKRFIPGLEKIGNVTRVQQGWQPCVSNPELPGVVAAQLIEYFDKNPDAIAINLAVNDGNGDCECDKCRAMDAPGADLANRIGLCDRYITFNNRVCELVAQKYPHKIIAFIAYGSMRLPPTTVKLHPMLMPVVTISRNFFDQWDGWLQQGTRHMGAYFYHDDQSFFVMPKMDIHQSARRIRYAVASGRVRHFYQEMYPLWPIDGMVTYTENELLWDPRLDVDQMLSEYYSGFFGPAAEAMKSFYDTLEGGYARWLEQAGLPHEQGRDVGSLTDGRKPEQFKVLTPEEAARAESFLEAAGKVLKPGSREAQRVEVVSKVFGFISCGARQYAAMAALNTAKVASETGATEVVKLAQKAVASAHAESAYKRDVMLKPPASLYAPLATRAGESNNLYFKDIAVGRVNPQLVLSVSRAFEVANVFLRQSLGADGAAAWWDKQRTEESDPVLADAMAIARSKARSVSLKNLVADGGFEERGAGRPPVADKPLDEGFEDFQGLHVWHRKGTPVHAAIVEDEIHSGKYAAMLNECGVTVLSHTVSTGGGHYHIEAWLRRNEPGGIYSLRITPTIATGKGQSTTVQPSETPDQWQKMELDYTAPADTRSLTVAVLVTGQATGAKVWIDDVFVGKYAE